MGTTGKAESSNKMDRNSNHELLRLLAMYMIVFIHANMFLSEFCEGSERIFFNGLVNGVCNIGVSCFILISGYYGVRFDIRKLIKMECMMITFSFLETAILFFVFPEEMQGAGLLEQIVKSLFPFVTRKYWFYSCYVCLMLFSGCLQKLIDSLEKEEFRRLLLIMGILFSIFPTVFYFELIPDNGKGLVQMIMVYLTGRYIRMYRDIQLPKVKSFLLFLILWLINGVSHEHPIQVGGIYHHLCKDNSITNLVMAVILFYLFKELRIRSRLINQSAAYLFAVFALNNALVSVVMRDLLKRLGFHHPDGVLGFLCLAGIVFLILVVCLFIGKIREVLFGWLDGRLGRKIIIVIDNFRGK